MGVDPLHYTASGSTVKSNVGAVSQERLRNGKRGSEDVQYRREQKTRNEEDVLYNIISRAEESPLV